MLRQIHISGLGVIDDVDLELHPGLNVITGETGTGKTLVAVGLALALGRRASASLVRAGAGAARVQARFDAPAGVVEEGWAEEGEVVLGRAVSADGRGTARIGRQLVPTSALASLGADLVEIHGQHEGTRLLSAAEQTAFCDRFAGAPHLEAVAALRAEHEGLRSAREALGALLERERDRERELDLLAYQIREIEAAAPRPGELDSLGTEEARLAHAERLLELAGTAERRLVADDAAADGLRAAAAELRSASELDQELTGLADRAEEQAAAASELARDLREYRDRLELDPHRLEEVRERIAALGTLLRKYGEREEDVLDFLHGARERASGLAGAQQERARLEAEADEATERVTALAATVSRGRAGAAPRLAKAIVGELRELGMPDAVVEVEPVPLPEATSSGSERVEFRFSGGAGQPVRPLVKVASGGELSRVMLACRSVLVDLDQVSTLVFDEVDAGIGGRAGVAVGGRLAALARDRQVIVVTHLPQIASFADRHVRVDKRKGSAVIEVLDDGGRVRELTRMLAGLPGSEAAATHAQELLAEAGKAKSEA